MNLTIERLEMLLLIAAVVALVAKRWRLPTTVGLVIAGAVLSSFGLLQGYALTKDLIFRILLPPLIFEAAFFIHWKELRKNFVPILTLASIGVLIGTAIVAATMTFVAGWALPVAIVFGALIAATDPVSVIAMFKDLKVEGRLRILVEAESLFNDGVAAVLFSVGLLYAGGAQMGAGLVIETIAREAVGGIICGGLVAAIVLFLAGRTEEHLVEITFSAIAAFGSFLLAEHFHCSGVLSVLTAGLLIGNLGSIGAITDRGREAVGAFWEFAAFVSNSIVFILIGVREHALGSDLVRHSGLIVLAIVGSLAGRALAVYGISSLFGKSKHRIENRHQHVLFWGGLRGALSLALVIGLPLDFPMREELAAVAFGVVAFSVIVQGLTMPPLMKRLGIGPGEA